MKSGMPLTFVGVCRFLHIYYGKLVFRGKCFLYHIGKAKWFKLAFDEIWSQAPTAATKPKS